MLRALPLVLLLVPIAGLEAQERPNVLFITVDDLNDMVGAYGYDQVKTPNLDQLASEGVMFTNAHCQYPICGPSRASLMTGLYATTLGYIHDPSDDHVQKRGNELGVPSLPQFFKAEGYRILAAGKLFHKHLPKGVAHKSNGRGGWDSYKGGKRQYKTKGTLTDWGVIDKPEEEMSDPKAAAWAVEQLQQEQQQPFMLMVGFIRPHVPWLVPQRWFDLYPDPKSLTLPPYKADDLDDVPEISRKINIASEMPRTEWLIKEDKWHDMLHGYLASVSFVDHYVGEVLKALAASPYADNTIVVLCSDHGYHLGEKNTTQKHSLWERASSAPY